MKTVFLILTVVLWIVIRYASSKAKQNAETDATASEPSQPSFSSVRSAFESLFEDEEAEAEPTYSSFAQEEAQAGYYSYENVEESEVDAEPSRATSTQTTTTTTECSTMAPAAETEEPLAPQDFDLRQAIIYQTILSNKYLDEIHPTDN